MCLTEPCGLRRGQFVFVCSHSVLDDGGRPGAWGHGTIVIAVHNHLATNEASQVATLTLTVLIHVVNLWGVFSPAPEPRGPPRLVPRTAPTPRAAIKLCLPGIAGYGSEFGIEDIRDPFFFRSPFLHETDSMREGLLIGRGAPDGISH